MRKWVSVVLGGALLAGLAGCSVRTNGSAGISVDETGRLIVVLAWCGPAPDGVQIYHEPATVESSSTAESTTGGPYVKDANYHAPALSGQRASFRLDAPSGGWTVTPEPLTLDPAITYTAAGFTRDNTSALNHVEFEAGDVAKVEPGRVLTQKWDEKRKELVDVVMSLQEFERLGQDPANCP